VSTIRQVRVAAAAALDEGEVAAGFGEQVPAVKATVLVHHEHRGRDGDVEGGGDAVLYFSGRGVSARGRSR
jgi:hypothetical protein